MALSPSLFAILFVLHIVRPALTQTSNETETLVQEFDVSAVASNFVDRIFSLSTSAPVSNQLHKNLTAQQLLIPTYQLFDDFYELITIRRNRSHRQACNLSPTDSWSKLADQLLQVFQVGKIDNTCFSLIDASVAVRDGDLPKSIMSKARDVLRQGRETLFYAAVKMPLPRNTSWSDSDAPYKLVSAPLRRTGQMCTKENQLAFLRNGEWYLQMKMTNRPTSQYLSDRERNVVMEWVPQSFNHSLHMIQKRLSDEQLENSTTIVNLWGGYGDSIDGEKLNPVVSEAFRRNAVQIDLASDAVTISNIAILSLPMVMNIIPVAFVADLNPVGTLAYVLFTDVISTIPFIVKGVELILSARQRQPVVMGLFGGNVTLGQMEIWSVECTGQVQFRTTGIIFVVVGCAMLVAGVIIELWAWQLMQKRNLLPNNSTNGLQGPFGSVLMNRTTNGLFGARETELQELYLNQAERLENEITQSSRIENIDDAIQQSRNSSTWRKRWRT